MSKKVVVISGANGGLGRALCAKYAAEGFIVVGLVRRGEIMETFRHEMLQNNTSVQVQKCDITDENQCREAIATVLHHYGRIDVLINNAGRTNISTFRGPEDLKTIRQLHEINFLGAVTLTAYALEALKRSSGQLISISSVAGFAPLYGRTAYASSKFAMEGFFRTIATELKTYGVHHLMVYPTFIATAIRDEKDNSKTTGEVLTAEYCADQIFSSAKGEKRSLLLGSTAKKSYTIYKILPKLYEKLMTKKMIDKVD